MSQPCIITTCKGASYSSCNCCQQNLCNIHLNEHSELLHSQLNPLADNINVLIHRFEKLCIHETVRDYHKKLEQWRSDSYQKIDHLFKEKCKELDQLVSDILDNQKDKLNQTQSKITKLIQNKDTTRKDIESLTSTITQFDNELKNIESTLIQCNISPSIINDQTIYFEKLNKKQIDLAKLSSTYKETKYPPGSYCPLASNDKLLLIHQAPNLCFMNSDIVIIKEIPWTHKAIRDISWSSTLKSFIIIEEHNIFLVNENTMSIECIETIEKRKWFSCTCSDSYLFLTTGIRGSSIFVFHLSPSINAIKEWKSPHTCTKDEFINGIAYKNDSLALMIKNKLNNTLRLELRTCEKLDHIWAVSIDFICNQNIAFRFCSFGHDEWLIADYQNGYLLHINHDGRLEKVIPYKAMPYYVCMFGFDTLAVSSAQTVNFHKV